MVPSQKSTAQGFINPGLTLPITHMIFPSHCIPTSASQLSVWNFHLPHSCMSRTHLRHCREGVSIPQIRPWGAGRTTADFPLKSIIYNWCFFPYFSRYEYTMNGQSSDFCWQPHGVIQRVTILFKTCAWRLLILATNTGAGGRVTLPAIHLLATIPRNSPNYGNPMIGWNHGCFSNYQPLFGWSPIFNCYYHYKYSIRIIIIINVCIYIYTLNLH
jgi:hypothetical protein